MGTHGLIVFVFSSGTQRRVTYCHFDGYPTGLGKDIVNFIVSLKPEQCTLMNERLEKIEWVDEQAEVPQDLQEQYHTLGYSKPSGDERQTQWYWVLRDVQGGKALQPILDGNLKHLVDAKFKEGDEEYSYVVDFQEMTLETWAGNEAVDKRTFKELAERNDYMEELEKKIVEDEREDGCDDDVD